ncbi:glucose-6-phosphate isomerase [Candidatus Sulfidibacterium hydrothermale]|uniref:glucose-6-phosphate isomerase n=1 Tax=Candidatus Sulfidibacterium hydrothermale TaxID=2875962 RepID=UPI001F0B1313|nr:glucose-6-phosphate isomerase [Candidatus Sulfidibacterium hydrothermale]UBM62280.1 glucose-6-phosphate isomerase [Candidatus Sulfidibacterium hydrothermale]
MIHLKFNYEKVLPFIGRQEIHGYQEAIESHFLAIRERTGKGSDFLGWTELPSSTDETLIKKIETAATRFREMSEVSVVVGIGGSYLGARAVIEALSPHFPLLRKKAGNPVMLYAGNNISEDYLAELLQVLDEKEYTLTVISKSGTTTEPALAFRLLREHMEKKYGKEEARNRIIAITDKEKGALKQLATEEGYETFVVPDDVGGRYSVLTPVGLLPIAVAGFDIRALLQGARYMQEFLQTTSQIDENPAAAYAAVRNALYAKGKTIEIMVNYEPALFYFTEWWKQLYGESEGKENKGIFPAGVSNTTDLHSMGQYIQEGNRILFETVLSVERPKHNLVVPAEEANLDKLNYIAGKRIHEVNRMAELGTALAHVDGGVPNLKVTLPEINETTLGELIYFYEMACAVSGYLLGINPFDQPGVEAYKRNMFALLGKPGFEEETERIREKLN